MLVITNGSSYKNLYDTSLLIPNKYGDKIKNPSYLYIIPSSKIKTFDKFKSNC